MQCMELPTHFWADAIATTVHLRNITPSVVLQWKTPKETWSGKAPRIYHFRVFGCHAEVYEPNDRRSKLDPKSRQCVFICYTDTWIIYRFYDVQAKRIVISEKAKFYEFDSVPETSSHYSEIRVFDTLLYDATIDVVSDGDTDSEAPDVENDEQEDSGPSISVPESTEVSTREQYCTRSSQIWSCT